MRVEELCNRPLVYVAPGASAVEIARKMRNQHVGSVVVAENGSAGLRALGIITDRDLALLLVARDIEPELVIACDIMSSPLETCRVGEDIDSVIGRMHGRSLRRIVVLADDGGAVGLVSIDDLTRCLAMEIARISMIGKTAIDREEDKLTTDS